LSALSASGERAPSGIWAIRREARFVGAALVALKLLNFPSSATLFWHSFAGGILAIAQ
jgi:hypothetical protein